VSADCAQAGAEISVTVVSGGVGPAGPTGPQGPAGATGPQGPAGAAGASAWSDITGKPSTFPPSAHTHAIADTTGLQAALDAKAPSDGPTFSGSVVFVGSTTELLISGSTINFDDGSSQATAFTGTLKTKLDGIAAGATANATDAQLRDRATHTGTQAVGTLATTGTASASTYLRGDGAWTAISTYTLPNATTSTLGGVIVGTGLGVTSGTASVTYGTTDGTACQGNDSRLSDARTPTSHVHAAGDITSGTIAAARLPASGVSGDSITTGTVAAARLATHATTHSFGGSDAATLCQTLIFTRSAAPAGAGGSGGSWTYTIPSAAKAITVDCIAGGGGGGSGRRGAAGGIRGGGGAGAGGGRTIFEIQASELSSLGLSVSVGAGGAGGAAQGTNDTNGNAGASGGNSQVTITSGGAVLAFAYLGTGGGGGTNAAGGAGGFANGTSIYNGATGGAGGAAAGPGTPGFGQAGQGGGGGGGITAADAAQSGQYAHSTEISRNTQASPAGGALGTAGGAGQTGAAGGAGGGGAGGGASITAAAGAGGAGGAYGGGGGGGGASLNGNASGAGGNGGDGVVRITVWY
jgi:hypothetical protein